MTDLSTDSPCTTFIHLTTEIPNTLEVSTHSNIHQRFKKFASWISTDEEKEADIRKQADEIRDNIEPKAQAFGLTVRGMPYSGSFAKRTGLKRFLRGGTEVEGQDVDIAFILGSQDQNGKDLGCQIHNFKRWLSESYPNSDVGNTKSSATIAFSSTKLSYDLVPLVETSKQNVQKLIRTDGKERQSSVVKHVEFVQSRNKESNNLQGVVKYNRCLRLIKWWRYEQQSKSGVFGNEEGDEKVPSFLLDLLSAKAFAECSVQKTYPETLASWFAYLAHIVRNRESVWFSDFNPVQPEKGDSKWLVADPVDSTNNVVSKWQNDKINELASWFESARSKMIQANRKDGDQDDTGSMDCLVPLFGTAFKNNS